MKVLWVLTRAMIRELIRKKDFYVLLTFMVVLLVVLASQSFFQMEGITRYIRDFGYSITILFSFIIAVTTAAKQLPLEIERKTIYPLLSKPISRQQIVAGKFLGSAVVSFISFSLFFWIFAFFSLRENGAFSGIPLMLQAYFLGILFLCLVSAIVIFFSNFLTVSANITLIFLLYVVIGGFSDSIRRMIMSASGVVLSAISGILYYAMPHFEFYDMRVRITHNWDAVSMWVILYIAAYTAVYCIFLLYFSGLLFRRKKL